MILELNLYERVGGGEALQHLSQHKCKNNTVLCNESGNRFSYPVHGAKVDSFSKVEALVESTVVSSGESDDELARTLVGAIDLVIRMKRRKNYKLCMSNSPCFYNEHNLDLLCTSNICFLKRSRHCNVLKMYIY